METIMNYFTNIDVWVIVPLIFALIELMQIHRSRIAETLYNIFSDIHSEKNLQNIEWFYTMNLADYRILSADDKRRIDDVIDIFTRIAFLCDKRLIPKKYVVHMYSGLIIHVWQHAKSYVITKRSVTGVTNYACYFEKIYKKALNYRVRHGYSINIRNS